MAAAAKHNERKGNCSKASGKRATSPREAMRKQAGESKSEPGCSSANPEEVTREVTLRRPRMDFAEALREKGLDEFKLAGICKRVMDKAKRNCEEVSELKFLMDCVEKVARVLESKRANDRAGDRGGAQVLVQLVHQVARPERGMEALAATPREGNAEDVLERISPAQENFAPEMYAIDVRTDEARD